MRPVHGLALVETAQLTAVSGQVAHRRVHVVLEPLEVPLLEGHEQQGVRALRGSAPGGPAEGVEATGKEGDFAGVPLSGERERLVAGEPGSRRTERHLPAVAGHRAQRRRQCGQGAPSRVADRYGQGYAARPAVEAF